MIQKRELLTVGVILAVGIAWWFAYGAPAAQFFRSQNVAHRSLAAAAADTRGSSPIQPPIVTVSQSASLGSIQSTLAQLEVSCEYVKLWRDSSFSTAGITLAGQQGETHRSIVLDSTELARLTSLVDTVLTTAVSLGKVSTATTIAGQVKDAEVQLIIGAGGLGAAIIIGGEYFFLEQSELRRLSNLFATGWATCQAKRGGGASP